MVVAIHYLLYLVLINFTHFKHIRLHGTIHTFAWGYTYVCVGLYIRMYGVMHTSVWHNESERRLV